MTGRFWLFRLDNERMDVRSDPAPPGEETFPSEFDAHLQAINDLLDHRAAVSAAIKWHRSKLKAARTTTGDG